MKYGIQPGVVVVCLDDSDVEDVVSTGKYYLVLKTDFQGHMLRLVDVPVALAASRFAAIQFGPAFGAMTNNKAAQVAGY